MPSLVYVETSVISYLAARQSRDVIVAARQAITRDWWEHSRRRFEIYVSVLVVEESLAGDPDAAVQRAQTIAGNNAQTKARIRTAVETAGYECPVMCSPEELGGEE